MNSDANVIIAGGQESMSQSPHCMHLRNGTKMGDDKMIDSMIKDGLWDAFNGYHMGTTAENVAQQWQITRDQQDEFAFNSQQKASKAKEAGVFKDEIVGVEVKSRKETVVFEEDEYIKDGVQLEKIASLRPAFAKEGSVTAANASGINDGAAALTVMSADEIKKRNIQPTKLLPLWDLMGVTLGFGTAMLGEKAAMLCTASVEEVIDGHYKDQTYKLGKDEEELKKKIMKFRQDELDHKDIAYDNGATKKGLFGVLDKVIKTSSRIAITISEKI